MYPEKTRLNKTKTFAKNPDKGGIPATEKKIITNDQAHNLSDLNKFAKLDKKSDDKGFE